MAERLGITALLPPELIFSCDAHPIDLNNFVPRTNLSPKSKLCAWTAIWRDLVLNKRIVIDKLAVVAGGDCHNALVDGEKVALQGIPTHYFFYPFDHDEGYLEGQFTALRDFLGGIKDDTMFKAVKEIKELGLELDRKRSEGKISSSEAFKLLVSFSDLEGDFNMFKSKVSYLLKSVKSIESPFIESDTPRVALLGVPPIHPDFHEVASSLNIHIVFDELPFEFVRLSGTNIMELAQNYSDYTFARDIEFRLDFLDNELEKRKIDGIVHYTQFACHHMLEDEILRNHFDHPILTVQGDLPRCTPEQLKLRLEAFAECLSRR